MGIDEMWMLDLVSSKWAKSSLRIPAKGKFHASLLTTQSTSADADTESAESREVRLLAFDHGAARNRRHFRIALSVLLGSMQSVAVPTECLTSEWTKVSVNNEKLWQQQRAKLLADSGKSMEAMAKEIKADKALSNRQKAKLIRKLKQKRYKYEHSDFSAPANASLLLPPSLVDCKEDDEAQAVQLRAQYEAKIKNMRKEFEKKLATVQSELEALRAKVAERDTKKLLNGLAMASQKKQHKKEKQQPKKNKMMKQGV